MRPLLTITILSLLFGCGTSLTTEQILNIEMYGAPALPDEGATGTEDPKWLEYTLTGVTFVAADSGTAQVVYSGTDASEARIVNRAQIIYTKDVSTLNGEAFSGATMTFSTTVKGANSTTDALTFTMASESINLDSPFEVKEGKGVTIYIKLKWKETTADTSLTEPTYVVTVEET